MLVAWQRVRELTQKISEFQVRTKPAEVVGSIPTTQKLKGEPKLETTCRLPPLWFIPRIEHGTYLCEPHSFTFMSEMDSKR